MTEEKKPKVSKQVMDTALEWDMTPSEANYLVKKLAHCRMKAIKKQEERLQEYADVYGCIETGAKAKTAKVQRWQESLEGRRADDMLEEMDSLEKLLLRAIMLDVAESLVVKTTGVLLGGVREQIQRAGAVVKFFRKVRRAVGIQRITTKQLGRYSDE